MTDNHTLLDIRDLKLEFGTSDRPPDVPGPFQVSPLGQLHRRELLKAPALPCGFAVSTYPKGAANDRKHLGAPP